MYKVKIEKFEGPLDLLLELIESERLDITEISMAKITDKYLNEVSHLDPKSFDVAEFMVVAARLLYLKSKALLPSVESAEEEAELEDLKEKLAIYKKYKEAGRQFGSILEKNQRSYPVKKPKVNFRNFSPPKGVDMSGLWKVFQKLLTDMPQELSREEVELPSEKMTVEQKLADLEKLFAVKKTHKFSQVLKSAGSKLEAIIIFLAVLEMVKLKQLKVEQKNNFNDFELVRL